MKTKIKNFAIFIALVLGIFVSSCSKEDLITKSSELQENKLLLKNGSTGVECELIAGQSINVGYVIFSHDLENIYVTYTTSEDWLITELHLYVGNKAGLPQNKTAVQIGHFPFSISYVNGVTAHTFTIPIEGLSKDADGYLIAAHAVVVNGTQEETAWANCNVYKPLITLKSSFKEKNADGSKKWAASGGTFEYNNLGWWCPWLGTNIFENGDEYTLQSWMFPSGAGKVNVSEDATHIFIVVDPNDDLTLEATYLFVGDKQGLDALGTGTGGCPNYMLFPYQNFEPTLTHNFKIPKPLSSFSFSGNRWGWYSYYKF